jgi:uncharacterized protein
MMPHDVNDHPRMAQAADLAGMLALNAANEIELSPLNQAELQHLMVSALYCGVVGPVGQPVGFLLVLDQDAAYDSPNFLWFRQRLERFAYIDRIVIDAAARGAGNAGKLYAAAFSAARTRHHHVICCEVNQTPPNPASDRFHARLGFSPVGQATLFNRDDQPEKTVQYLQASL